MPEPRGPPWVKWRDRLPEADRQYGNARLAYHAARQLNPSANDWFREVGDAPLSPEAQAWRVRAALRALAWNDVLAAIDAMSESQRQESRVALLARARAGRPRPAEESSGDARTRWRPRPISTACSPPKRWASASRADERAAFGIVAGALRRSPRGPRCERVVKLAELDMRPESQREWLYIVRGLPDDDALLLAADYARRVGLYDRAINTADRTTSAPRLCAALPGAVPHASSRPRRRAHDVDVALLYGIARQESRFAPDIVSSAGAVGLMQLMPGTARWVAKQLARNDFRPARSPTPS